MDKRVGCGTKLFVALLMFFFLCLIFPGFAAVAAGVLVFGLILGVGGVLLATAAHSLFGGGK